MGNTQCCEHGVANEFQPTYLTNKKEQSNASFHQNNESNQQYFIVGRGNDLNQNEEKRSQHDHKLTIEVIYTPSLLPQLSLAIQKHLESHKYFEEQFNFVPQIKQFDKQIYQGQLNKLTNKPEGYGKMYKSDGSLFIGNFHLGKAEGHGVYIMPNGSYYIGHFTNNRADGQGRFWSEELEYEGSFKNNAFSGKGSEKSRVHQFSGEYYEGVKSQGVLKWKDQDNNEYVYRGRFNFSNQFHGDGSLEEPTGTYAGDFMDGLKHGKGVYKYQNGLRYEGDYKQGKKCGLGILFNLGDTVAYQGEFQNDFPHGKGSINLPQTGKTQTKWVYGIDSVLL